MINQIPDKTIKVGEKYNYKVNAQDQDNDPISYSINNMPTGMTIGSDGTISWTPKDTDVGTYKLTVIVSDGRLNASQSFTLKVVKNEPAKISTGSLLWPLILLIIIIIVIVIVAVIYMKKRKHENKVEVTPPPSQPAPIPQAEVSMPVMESAPVEHSVEEVVDLDELENGKKGPGL
jgi:hypothetical protein